MKKHNFSAGPSILPESVLQQASEAVLNFNNVYIKERIKEKLLFFAKKSDDLMFC